MKFQKILCPIDFSESSRECLDAAQTLAEMNGAEVHLLHVIEPYIMPIEYGLAPVPYIELENSAKENAKTGLEKIAKERFPKLETKIRVEAGRAAEVIVQDAKREKIDLIVLSTHGRRGFSHLFIGSVAERVVRLAPCPVLTVGKRS